MSLNQELHWDTLFNKYDKIEKDLLKIMENAQESNDHTVKKLNALIKENRTFECELINMNREMTNIVEKLKEECMSIDVKQKLKKGMKKLKKYVMKGIKIHTERNIKAETKQKKRDHETNLSYSQKSINIKDSNSEMCIKNLSRKLVKTTEDVSKEIEEKEKQIFDTINWAYEKMNLVENNIEQQNLREEKQDETNTKNIPSRKGIILNQLKFMHRNLQDELVELQKNQDFLNNTVNWTDNVDDKVEDMVGKQINSFAGFMTEVLSQLTTFYHKIITENDQDTTQKEGIETKSKKELLYILRDTSVIMKKLFLIITEKFIDNNVEAAFKKGIEESKIIETNESIQSILNNLIFTFENTNNKVEERTSMSFLESEVEEFKITYENMKKAYNSIQNLKGDKIEVDVKVKLKPSKIPKYKHNNLSKIVEKKFVEEENHENLKEITKKSKERLLEQLNSTYDNMTSEYEIIKEKLKENSLNSRNNDKIKENGKKKSKIAVQDILKQLKSTYEDMKNEYKAVVQHLNDRSLENKITEEELLLQKLGRVKENKQEILHRLKSISSGVKDCKEYLNKEKQGRVLGKSKKRKMKEIYGKPDNRKEKFLKKPKRFKRLSAKLKCYNMKDDSTQHFTEKICGHFITKHEGTEKSKHRSGRERFEITGSIKDIIDNDKYRNPVDENLNDEKPCLKMRGNKLGYERAKEEYMQLTTKTENLLKKINQIEEHINVLEKNVKEETRDTKVFKQLKSIYTDLKEKYNYYVDENDILKKEITALERDKTNIGKEMSSLEKKMENFKTNKKELLTDLETAYEDLRQNFYKRIKSEERKLEEKITKFISDGKNLEKSMMSLERRVNEYENGINNIIKELELNYNVLKKQYRQIISEYKTNREQDISSDKNVRKKIEKEMDNIELKLKTFKIGDVLKQKEETTDTQTVEEKSDILKMNDFEFIYIKEEQVQTTDDKENQTHINDSTTKLLEDATTSTVLKNEDEDISATACDIQMRVSDKKIVSFDTISLQTEELSCRNAKNECMFTETDKFEENSSKQDVNKEELVEEKRHKSMVRIAKSQLNKIFDKNDDSEKEEVIIDELNRNYSGKYIKGDEIIRKAEEQLSRLDKELNEDVVGKGGDIVRIAEEQLDRIKRYLRTYNDCDLRKVDVKFKYIKNKSKNTVEQMENIDLKELILLHEKMVKCEKKEKFKDIRQLKSVLKMQFKGGEETVRGQESGDKSIDFKEKLKVVKLPNQSLCGYQRFDLDEEINESIEKLPQKVEKVYVNYPNEDRVKTNKLKMILKAEKETFKELKQVLMEKSDRLENINDILKRMLESTAKNGGSNTKQNIGDSKQWNLKIVRLPSQNLKPEATNENKFLNLTKYGYNIESETEIMKELMGESNEKLKLETERVTSSLKTLGRYKNVEKRLKSILDGLAPEDINNMQAYLEKYSLTENKNDVMENKSDEIFKLKKEIAELKLEGRQRKELLTLQKFEGLFKGNTKHNQRKYRGLLNNPSIFEDDIKKKNRDGKGWFEMSVGENHLWEDEREIESRTIHYDEIFDESKEISSITILCKNRFGSSEHLLEDNDYLEKIRDKYENQKSLLKDMLEDKFDADNELMEMRIEECLKRYHKSRKEESSVILEENSTTDLLKNSGSKMFQLKGNIILKDEVASMTWETVIGRDYDISIFNQDAISSRPKETTINDLFLEQRTSFDTSLLYPRSYSKSNENEEEKRVREVDKSAVLNEETDLINTSEMMEVTYSSEIMSLDVISEEMFIDSHSFESQSVKK